MHVSIYECKILLLFRREQRFFFEKIGKLHPKNGMTFPLYSRWRAGKAVETWGIPPA